MTTQDTSVIPRGVYCYDQNGNCPYWILDKRRPYQSNGYCEYLKCGDWMKDGTFLLWDQVKECGINEEEEENLG